MDLQKTNMDKKMYGLQKIKMKNIQNRKQKICASYISAHVHASRPRRLTARRIAGSYCSNSNYSLLQQCNSNCCKIVTISVVAILYNYLHYTIAAIIANSSTFWATTVDRACLLQRLRPLHISLSLLQRLTEGYLTPQRM